MRSVLDHSGFLPSIILVVGLAGFLRMARNSLWQVALFSLPGTVAHELSHFIVGAVTLAHPVRLSLWPRRSAKLTRTTSGRGSGLAWSAMRAALGRRQLGDEFFERSSR